MCIGTLSLLDLKPQSQRDQHIKSLNSHHPHKITLLRQCYLQGSNQSWWDFKTVCATIQQEIEPQNDFTDSVPPILQQAIKPRNILKTVHLQPFNMELNLMTLWASAPPTLQKGSNLFQDRLHLTLQQEIKPHDTSIWHSILPTFQQGIKMHQGTTKLHCPIF